jgi:hypothetical protein
MYKKINLFLVSVFLVLTPCLITGCAEPSATSGTRIIHRDSQGRGYHSSSELPRVYVRPGQVFVPWPDLKFYIMTNEPPLDYNSTDVFQVVYTNPGKEELLHGPAKHVLMPQQYNPYSQPQQPVYVPQQPIVVQPPQVTQQQPIVVTAPPQHHRMESREPREVTCPTCGGTGRVVCPACHGQLYLNTPCGSCSGTGKQTCHLCNGSGTRGGHWKCDGCGGTGKVNCLGCSGTGKTKCQTCYYIFGPQGYLNCTRCNGTGKITR